MYPGVVELASTKVHDVTDSIANVFETESSGSDLRHSDPSGIEIQAFELEARTNARIVQRPKPQPRSTTRPSCWQILADLIQEPLPQDPESS